ncbi:MAG: hypothetical protein IJK84_02585 [Bacteroidales bacterium]|nr:hypothetical protein [Bacteroidales bacterium]
MYNSTFVDWSTNNIPDGFGGGMPWRTLSLSEWTYLLTHYTYGTATVNNTPGLVILPSDWNLPSLLILHYLYVLQVPYISIIAK